MNKTGKPKRINLCRNQYAVLYGIVVPKLPRKSVDTVNRKGTGSLKKNLLSYPQQFKY